MEVETVYHYTSLSGILGIVKNRGVWATHTSFLNDSTEFFHALSFAKQVAGGIFMEDDYLAAFGWAVRQALEEVSPDELYVTSFSERPDLLSQWRGYCPAGAGICLGFDFDHLKQFCLSRGYRLERCVYGHEGQIRQISELVQNCLNRFPKLPLTRERYEALSSKQQMEYSVDAHAFVTTNKKIDADAAVGWLCNEIAELAPLLKNEGFHEEAEWRIVANRSEEMLHFRANSSYVAPYIELGILANEASSALREVIVGPNPNQDRCAESINVLLSAHRLGNVAVKCSSLPFNSW